MPQYCLGKRGTGVPPVIGQALSAGPDHGRDARATLIYAVLGHSLR
jgi:hypothetical protein